MFTVVALMFLGLLAQPAYAAVGREVTLVLPHHLRTGETAWLEVKLGVIEPGAEIEITTAAGQSLGVISPHGIRAGHPAGGYTLPVPGDAISDDRISLRVSLNRNGHAQRAPTAEEVKSVHVKIMPPVP